MRWPQRNNKTLQLGCKAQLSLRRRLSLEYNRIGSRWDVTEVLQAGESPASRPEKRMAYDAFLSYAHRRAGLAMVAGWWRLRWVSAGWWRLRWVPALSPRGALLEPA